MDKVGGGGGGEEGGGGGLVKNLEILIVVT